MPYRRYGKGPAGYRPRFKRRGFRSGYKGLSKRVAYLSKTVAKQQELHVHDVAVNVAASTAEDWTTHFTAIADGDASTQRTGLKISAKSLSYHLALTAADSTNFVRLVFLVDKAALGIAPGNYLQTGSDFASFRSSGPSVGRYHVLSDRTYKLVLNESNGIRYIQGHFNLHNRS